MTPSKGTRYALSIGSTLIIGAAAFFAGRTTAKQPVEVVPQPAAHSQQVTPQAATTYTPPPQTLPQPTAATAAAQNDQSAEQAPYVLRYMEGELVVWLAGEKIAHIEAPENLSPEIVEQLQAGIRFETLEDIEGFLEGLET